MSLLVKSFLEKSLQYNARLFEPLQRVQLSQVKYLYSPASLGIDNYLAARKNIQQQCAKFSDKFRSKMTELVNDPKNIILTEDIKNMVHIAETTDLNLILDMLKKLNTQNSEFKYGTVIMRMFYFLDAPQEALQCFEDQCNTGFFHSVSSYQVLLDLLYKHEMYDDIYRVFDKVKERQINVPDHAMAKILKYPGVLVFGACYNQNTRQSFEYAAKLWKEMSKVTSPARRAATFFAGLALKQGAPHIAYESVSSQKPQYVTIRNIKAMALADMGRVDDALSVLKTVLDFDVPNQKIKHTFFEETILKVKEAVEKSNNKIIQMQFAEIEEALKDCSLIDSQTLDMLLNSEITFISKNDTSGGGQFAQRRRRRDI